MNGLNGLTLVEQIKRMSPVTSVILVSEQADVEQAVAAIRLGAEDYLKKPFNFEVVQARGQARPGPEDGVRREHGRLELSQSAQQLPDDLGVARAEEDFRDRPELSHARAEVLALGDLLAATARIPSASTSHRARPRGPARCRRSSISRSTRRTRSTRWSRQGEFMPFHRARAAHAGAVHLPLPMRGPVGLFLRLPLARSRRDRSRRSRAGSGCSRRRSR